jgi:hypothetical protein
VTGGFRELFVRSDAFLVDFDEEFANRPDAAPSRSIHSSSGRPSSSKRRRTWSIISIGRPSRAAVISSPSSTHTWQVLRFARSDISRCSGVISARRSMNDFPDRCASAAYIDQEHCVATGPMASSSAVVWVHPRGPPNSSRTLWVKPRLIDSPTRPW